MNELKPRHGRRSRGTIERDRATDEAVRGLGRAVAGARRRRRLTQEQLATRSGISRSSVARIEGGHGHGVPIATWIALSVALGLTPRFDLQRDWREEPADAGHLGIQELLLRLGRVAGYEATFELPIAPGDPARSIDVCLRSDSSRRLIVEEAWNTIGDIGAGARSFDRKLSAARDLAVAVGGDRPYDVHGVWVVRATRRNRELVARYPGVFATKFPGSSRRWVRAITSGATPPAEPGLVWSDIATTRVFEWRR
jgi:transcriptional regulator with XRE-family HTH domain